MNLEQAIERFEYIDNKTGILSCNIIANPTSGIGGERDELWNLTRIFLKRIYELDISNHSDDEMNQLCYYSIAALHWNDLYLTDDRFSYSNGRFRRDTVALAVCLFTRISRDYKFYQIIKRKFIMPHTRGSLLMWSLRSIVDCNRDNLLHSFEPDFAKEALDKYIEIAMEDLYFNEFKAPKDHPIIDIWWVLYCLFKSPRIPYKFILNYIWSSIDLPGGLGLLPEDRDMNKSYLKSQIINKDFPDYWYFHYDLAYTLIFFATETDKDFADEEENAIKDVIKEWFPDDAVDIDDKVDTIFDRALDLYNKDNSLIRFEYVLENIRTHVIQRANSKEENNEKRLQKITNQLSFILEDLVTVSKSDNNIIRAEYDLIESIRNSWGIDIKLFDDSEIPPNNSDADIDKEVSIDEDNKKEPSEYLENYPGDLYCENEHWWRSSRPLRIKNFPNVFYDNEYNIDDLFRRFTKDEVHMIANKIKATGNLIYLPFVREILSKKFDLRGIKNPFWFIPFCCYGNDRSGVLYYEQNGIMTNQDAPGKLSIYAHSDITESISCEPGYNGLTDDWNYDVNDEDVLSSLRIKWYNPNSGNSGYANIVETHGDKYASTLPIIKAIWDNAWKNVIESSKGLSCYMLGPPPYAEYFNSWDELLGWAKEDSENTDQGPGDDETKEL